MYLLHCVHMKNSYDIPSISDTFSSCTSPLEGYVWGSLKPLVTKINSGRPLKMCAHTWKNTGSTVLGQNSVPLTQSPAGPLISLCSMNFFNFIFWVKVLGFFFYDHHFFFCFLINTFLETTRKFKNDIKTKPKSPFSCPSDSTSLNNPAGLLPVWWNVF
jgi:hypothetical protein